MTVYGNEVKVGDVFPDLWFFHGRPGKVMGLRRYQGPLINLLGEGTQIAVFENSAGHQIEMTLPAVEWSEIKRGDA